MESQWLKQLIKQFLYELGMFKDGATERQGTERQGDGTPSDRTPSDRTPRRPNAKETLGQVRH